MTRNQKYILALLALGIFAFYWYAANEPRTKYDAELQFLPPAENAPLTQRELDIQKGLIPNEALQPPEEIYRDDIYRSQAFYLLPNQGQYTLKVIMTLKNEKVTAVSVSISPETANTEADIFVRNYRKHVVGKHLDDIELSIEGATLTSNAFNNTLRDIRKQALD